jgi:chitin synthase
MPQFVPGLATRQSSFGSPYGGGDAMRRQSMASMGGFGGDIQRMQSPFQDSPYASARPSMANLRSQSNVSPAQGHNPRASMATAMGYGGGNRPPLNPHDAMRASTSSFDFQRGNAGPDDAIIIEAIQAVLREVDLDTVTKKQVRALVEQRLQTELVGERRTFMDRQIDNELASM